MRKHEWELSGNVVVEGNTVYQKKREHSNFVTKEGFRICLSDVTNLDKEMVRVDIEVPERRLAGTCLTVAGEGDIKIRFSGFIQGEKSAIIMTTILNEIGQGIGITDSGDRAKVTIIA